MAIPDPLATDWVPIWNPVGSGPAGPSGVAPSGTGYAHVTGGVLDQPAQLYLDLVETTAPNPPADTKRLYALDVNGYTQVEMVDSAGRGVRLASDNVIIAKITEPTGVTRGQAVFISGASGANALVNLAKSDNINTMPGIGIVLDTGAVNAFTRVLTSGTLQGVNTSAFAEGVSLFVSPTTAGGFTTTLPVAPAYAQRIGFVTRSHATQGEILVLTTGTVTDPRLHAPTHSSGGTDPVTVTALAGYPGGTVNFLRADGTFAVPSTVGTWIPVAFNAANYTTSGGGGGTFVVDSQFNEQYLISGKTISYAIHFQVTIAGTPLYLRIALPPGVSANKNCGMTFGFGASTGMMVIGPSETGISLYINATFTTNWTAGSYFMSGTFTFSIN